MSLEALAASHRSDLELEAGLTAARRSARVSGALRRLVASHTPRSGNDEMVEPFSAPIIRHAPKAEAPSGAGMALDADCGCGLPTSA